MLVFKLKHLELYVNSPLRGNINKKRPVFKKQLLSECRKNLETAADN